MLKRYQFFVLALVGLVIGGIVTGHAVRELVVYAVGAAGAAGLGLSILGMAAGAEASSDVIRQLIAWGICDVAGGVKGRLTVAKTANYTMVSPATSLGDASGTLFTNRGAGGAVTFTLPPVALNLNGVCYDFVGFANQTWAVAAAAGTVCTFNNAAATSVTCSTAGAKIGAHIRAWCDGVSWHVNGDTVGVTYTVA